MTIRPAEASDADSIVRLWSESDDRGGSTNDAAAVRCRLCNQDGLFLIAEVAGQIVGSVIGGWDGWRGHIYRLVVMQGHRRQGNGSRLLNEAERAIREHGGRRTYARWFKRKEARRLRGRSG